MKITSEIKKGEQSTVDIIAEIAEKDLAKYKDEALQALGKETEIKGFRKGQVPVDVLEKHLGEMKILDEMAHLAISDAYPLLLQEHKINPLGRPMVNITKMATGNPLGFTITTAIVPEIKLADYKKIAKTEMGKKIDAQVTDKELQDAIDHIQKMRAQNDAVKDGADPKDVKDIEGKELDDEYVKTLGDFKDVAEFKEKLKENLEKEKLQKEEEKKQVAIADALIEKTALEVPQTLIDHELQKMLAQMEHDIAMSGMKFEDYLNTINKTRDDLKEDWKEIATKRAAMSLIIEEIAQKEELHPSEEEIETEAQKIMEQYKDMKDIDPMNVRSYVSSILTNQNVFKFFGEQK